MRRNALRAAAVLAAAAASGCVAGEQGRATAPAAGFTLELHNCPHTRILVGLWGDGNAKGTAAPDTTTGDQAVRGHDVQLPVR